MPTFLQISYNILLSLKKQIPSTPQKHKTKKLNKVSISNKKLRREIEDSLLKKGLKITYILIKQMR
ncbi:hypothetical protein XBKQ1_850010 [Xenorhabdus bovienii str. kraussei Quebec]|uniref:Uncharacterized protein n=1 Tax=Xenorhabdus bovienii str. kraussei Quebec TaxID=1398203 RepID=A0A077PLJ3_XENBV|nr:hypothetical protein XBKQ1_850010 [Xenorhabdus bovienii str. kraussei Quebec]